MKRTRKWTFVAQEAIRLATLGLSPKEIAKRLGVNRSSVTRWMQSGKLASKRPVKPLKSSNQRRRTKKPSEWAAAVRSDYQLDETDDQLVGLAEQALTLSLDPNVPANTRITAAGRFQAIVRQLALVARGEDKPGAVTPPAPEAPPRPEPVQRVDPRRLLMVVNK